MDAPQPPTAVGVVAAPPIPDHRVFNFFDLLLWGGIVVAGLAFFMCIWLWWRRPTPETSLKDLNALWKAVLDYMRDHGIVFVSLIGLTALFYIGFAWFALGRHKPSWHWTAEDFFLSLFAGVGSALVILVMTDFAAKRFLSRVIEGQRAHFEGALEAHGERIVSTLQQQEIICRVYRQTGLHALPSVRADAPSFKDLFTQIHSDCKLLKVISTSGRNWMRNEEVWQRSDPLPYLVDKEMTVQLLIYSPLLHFASLCGELNIEGALDVQVDRCLAWCGCQDTPLSADTPLDMLKNHLDFSAREYPELQRKPFRFDVRVTGCLLPSSFFTVDGRAAYATFPMQTRRHDRAIALTAYTASREFDPAKVVASFDEEFVYFWGKAVPFSEYIQANGVHIKQLVARSLQ